MPTLYEHAGGSAPPDRLSPLPAPPSPSYPTLLHSPSPSPHSHALLSPLPPAPPPPEDGCTAGAHPSCTRCARCPAGRGTATVDPAGGDTRIPGVNPTIVDRAMDATVVPGYTRLGYARAPPRFDRRRLWTAAPSSSPARRAASGARPPTASPGWREVLSSRATAPGAPAPWARSSAPPRTPTSTSSSATSATSPRSAPPPRTSPPGGRAGRPRQQRRRVAGAAHAVTDGIELTFARRRRPLRAHRAADRPAARGRPLAHRDVSSGGMYAQSLDVDDLQTERCRTGRRLLRADEARAGRADQEWTRRLGGLGITAHAMHPGWVDTRGARPPSPASTSSSAPSCGRPGGRRHDRLAGRGGGAAAQPGRFWHDRRERPTHRLPGTATSPEDAARPGRRASVNAGRRRRPVRAGLGVALRGVDRGDDGCGRR